MCFPKLSVFKALVVYLLSAMILAVYNVAQLVRAVCVCVCVCVCQFLVFRIPVVEIQNLSEKKDTIVHYYFQS